MKLFYIGKHKIVTLFSWLFMLAFLFGLGLLLLSVPDAAAHAKALAGTLRANDIPYAAVVGANGHTPKDVHEGAFLAPVYALEGGTGAVVLVLETSEFAAFGITGTGTGHLPTARGEFAAADTFATDGIAGLAGADALLTQTGVFFTDAADGAYSLARVRLVAYPGTLAAKPVYYLLSLKTAGGYDYAEAHTAFAAAADADRVVTEADDVLQSRLHEFESDNRIIIALFCLITAVAAVYFNVYAALTDWRENIEGIVRTFKETRRRSSAFLPFVIRALLLVLPLLAAAFGVHVFGVWLYNRFFIEGAALTLAPHYVLDAGKELLALGIGFLFFLAARLVPPIVVSLRLHNVRKTAAADDEGDK
ncbi:MAG: hypothetical protein LBM78_05090 [Clostridiales bacterium]|jgi:hypothetical protein|nr:hypothetical protein [Clostridiales bacterium]